MEGPARGRGTGTSALAMKQNLCVFQKNQNKPIQPTKQTKPTKTQTTTTTKQNKNLWKKIIHPVAKSDLCANPDYGRLQIQAAV